MALATVGVGGLDRECRLGTDSLGSPRSSVSMCQTMAHPKDSLAGPGARGGGFLWIDWTSDVRSRLSGLRPHSCAYVPSPVPRKRRPACSVAPHWAVPVAGSLPRHYGGAAGV